MVHQRTCIRALLCTCTPPSARRPAHSMPTARCWRLHSRSPTPPRRLPSPLGSRSLSRCLMRSCGTRVHCRFHSRCHRPHPSRPLRPHTNTPTPTHAGIGRPTASVRIVANACSRALDSVAGVVPLSVASASQARQRGGTPVCMAMQSAPRLLLQITPWIRRESRRLRPTSWRVDPLTCRRASASALAARPRQGRQRAASNSYERFVACPCVCLVSCVLAVVPGSRGHPASTSVSEGMEWIESKNQ